MPEWFCLAFNELSAQQVHDVLALRQAIFVLEQDCLYPDIDGRDPEAQHLFMYHEGALMAACRIFSPSYVQDNSEQVSSTDETSTIHLPQEVWVIGRVVVAQSARGLGLGRELMQRALDYCRAQQRNNDDAKPQPLSKVVKISAQARLKQFYEDLGFEQSSAPYDEDGIEHIEMRCDLG